MSEKLMSFVLLLAMIVGCSNSSSDNSATSNQQPPQQPAVSTQTDSQSKPAPPPPAPSMVMSAAGVTTDNAGNAAAPAAKQNKEPQSPTPQPGMVIEKADVGSGAKGHDYEQGIITTPVSTYFSARERIMFSIQIPKLLESYRFEHDFKGPKSHDEFMREVIQKYNINLPPLPPGHKYLFDPAKQELMVERPAE